MAKVIYIGDNVVELCEKLLAAAKEGKFTSLAAVTEDHKSGDIATSFALGHFHDVARVLGAVSVLQLRLLHLCQGAWDCDD